MAGVIKTKQGIITDGKKGGIFIGDRHRDASGGIPIVVEGGGSALVEDSEPLIIPEAVNNSKKHLFDGKQMTSKEILSAINTKYGGVPIKKKGGMLEKGGGVEKIYEIAKEGKGSGYNDNKTRYYSLTDSGYFDGKEPLKEAKEYAKKKGYSHLKLVSISYKQKDKEYKLEHGGTLNTEPIPVKSGSVIITRNAALDKTTKHNFNGKQLTNSEILSEINKDGGGVAFEEGGEVGEDIESNTKKIDSYTDKINKAIEDAGYFTLISHSRTNFGNSNYIIVSNRADEYGVPSGNEKKVRISDHSVSNYDRIFNEIHIGFNYNEKPSKEDIERTINYVLKELRWKFDKEKYFHKEDGVEEKKAYNVQTPVLQERDVITKEYTSKKGRQLYEVTRTYINPVVRWIYNEDGKVFYVENNFKFHNGGTVNDSYLNKALELLQSTPVPSLFQQAKEDSPEELIKYIAEQGQGLHDNNKEALYNSTCKMFGKELTDASIEAYPIKESGEEIIDCGCQHEKGGEIKEMVICQNCGWDWNIKDKEPNEKTMYLCDACTYDNSKHYK